jgi:hypothetical protein
MSTKLTRDVGKFSTNGWDSIENEVRLKLGKLDDSLKHLEQLAKRNTPSVIDFAEETISPQGCEVVKLPYHNLPNRQNPNFYGREDELSKIRDELGTANHVNEGISAGSGRKAGNALSIAGLGGVGKTQIALHFAYRQIIDGLMDMVLWVDSETPEAISQCLCEIALGMELTGAKAEATVNNKNLLFRWLEKTGKHQVSHLSSHILPRCRRKMAHNFR